MTAIRLLSAYQSAVSDVPGRCVRTVPPPSGSHRRCTSGSGKASVTHSGGTSTVRPTEARRSPVLDRPTSHRARSCSYPAVMDRRGRGAGAGTPQRWTGGAAGGQWAVGSGVSYVLRVPGVADGTERGEIFFEDVRRER